MRHTATLAIAFMAIVILLSSAALADRVFLPLTSSNYIPTPAPPSRIAYASGRLLSPNHPASYICTMTLDGKPSSGIAGGGFSQADSPAWSPDGRRIAYELDGDVYIADMDYYGRPSHQTNLTQAKPSCCMMASHPGHQTVSTLHSSLSGWAGTIASMS